MRDDQLDFLIGDLTRGYLDDEQVWDISDAVTAAGYVKRLDDVTPAAARVKAFLDLRASRPAGNDPEVIYSLGDYDGMVDLNVSDLRLLLASSRLLDGNQPND